MNEIRVYFEGAPELKEGFRRFLDELYKEAGRRRCRLDLIATRGTPVEDYRTALRTHPEAWNILLLDSDGPFVTFDEVCQRKQLRQLPSQDSTFWMVQTMESWFLADTDALSQYYGRDFDVDALKGSAKVEEIHKADAYNKLGRATRETKKGGYQNTRHAPELLASINPGKVRAAAPNCDRLFREVLARLRQP